MSNQIDKNNNTPHSLVEEREVIKTRRLIIGFGLSAIPVLREFDQSHLDYTVISENDTIWRSLKKKGRLDFDLVSSKYSSFFSFDLVNDLGEDAFPTAEEFYEYQLRYYEIYKDKIIDDCVTKIENFKSHSLVYTKKGRIYDAEHVVVATGYKRKITSDILNFDTSIKNKTVVFTTIGDTANMLISKLIANNNRIIILQNGFMPLDKILKLGKNNLTLDQYEFHMIRFYSKRIYSDLISGSLGGVDVAPFGTVKHMLNDILSLKNKNIFTRLSIFFGFLVWQFNSLIAKIFEPGIFTSRYKTGRHHKIEKVKFPMILPNGFIAVKYWPIDVYAQTFGESLDSSIAKGHFMNDLPFLIEEKQVELLPKRGTLINADEKFIKIGEDTISFDYLVEGGPEESRMPHIDIKHGQKTKPFEWTYRDAFMGVLPQELNQIYFIGLTRPLTGGIANVTEMQSLFIHKLVTNPDFRHSIHQNLSTRIKNYNETYYLSDSPTKTDHVVFYGYFTEELARLIGINLKLNSCRSFKDLNYHFFFPNNTFKYRLKGEYKIDGIQALVDVANKENHFYLDVHFYLLTYVLYRILFLEATLMLGIAGLVSWWLCCILIAVQFINSKIFVLLAQYYMGVIKLIYLIAFIVCLPFIGVKWFAVFIGADILFTFIQRRLGYRLMFNDMNFKRRYRRFFYEKYLPALKNI